MACLPMLISSAGSVIDRYPYGEASTWRRTGSICVSSLLAFLTKGAGGQTKGVKLAFLLTYNTSVPKVGPFGLPTDGNITKTSFARLQEALA